MTRQEIAELALDYTNNYFTKYLNTYTEVYKYRGKTLERKRSKLSEEGKKVGALLESQKIFTCSDCGEQVSALELEIWTDDTLEDLINNKISCSECYENAMGEDL
jgi:hypothetical protein